MSSIDVRDLAKEDLAKGRFPVDPRADFRLFMAPDVHRGTWDHARHDKSVEICGVLVGRWERDENGPYAVVTNFIRCEQAASKFAEVTFTHESWAQINSEMDTKYAELRIIGWYHSHPDFGIFLSERDCFIQEHFFSGPGQIAYVIDPVRELEGAFAWRAGKPELLPYYWVGNEIRTVEASRTASGTARTGDGHASPSEMDQIANSGRRDSAPWGFTPMLLAWLALFLLGYLYGSWRSRWEQEKIIEGTVAHYGYTKLMKIGLEENVAKVRAELARMTDTLANLPESTEGLSEDEVENVTKQRKLVISNLRVLEQALDRIEKYYGQSPEERQALLNLMAQKQAELRKLMQPKPKSDDNATDGGAAKSASSDEPVDQ